MYVIIAPLHIKEGFNGQFIAEITENARQLNEGGGVVIDGEGKAVT